MILNMISVPPKYDNGYATSETVWKKKDSVQCENTIKKPKRKKINKNINNVDELEILEMNYDTKKNSQNNEHQDIMKNIFDNWTNQINDIYNTKLGSSTSYKEGFDLILDNSGNFKKVEDATSSAALTIENGYSNLMNSTAEFAENISKSATDYTANIDIKMPNVSDNLNKIGKEVSHDVNDATKFISNLFEPKDFADLELQEDLKNNRIFMVPPKTLTGSCKSSYQPYKPPAPPDYNELLNEAYKKSVLYNNSTTADYTTAEMQELEDKMNEIDTTGTDKNLSNSDIANIELQQIKDIGSNTSILYDNPVINTIFQIFGIIEYPFIYWRWLIKKLGIFWCNLMYTLISSFYNNKYNHPTDDEKRLVISNFNKILSFLFSILITYNWFFLMYYNFNGEKIKTYKFNTENLKKFSSILHFILEFVMYPLECMDWLILKILPKWGLSIFRNNMNLIFIITFIICNIITLSSIGSAIIDLFYDSLKLLFNRSLKPWKPEMLHTYDSIFKNLNFESLYKTNTNNIDKKVKYSVTLSTYIFLHIMIFYSQICLWFPTIFKKTEETVSSYIQGPSSNSDSGSGSFNMGDFSNGTNNMANNLGLASSAAGLAGNVASGLGSAASSAKDLFSKNKSEDESHHDQSKQSHQQQTKHSTNAHKQKHISKRKGGFGLSSIGKMVNPLSSITNPFSKISSFLPSMPSFNNILPGGMTGGFLGALGSVIIAIIRFCISHYLVNIAACFIAFYLIWYSLLGISWFSQLSFFKTINEIHNFIMKSKENYIYENCVDTNCQNIGFFGYIKKIIDFIVKMIFPVIFYCFIFLILIHSCFEYSGNSGIESSPYLKYGLLSSNIIIMCIVAFIAYNFTKKKET